MKYIVFDEMKNGTGDIFSTEHETKAEAIEAAQRQWEHLTFREQRQRNVYVLESVNPDEEAEDHFDGNTVWTATDLYVADRETGTFIELVKSIEAGKELIKKFEERDKADGTYKEGFYTVVDAFHREAEED